MNDTDRRTSPFDWNSDGHLVRITIDGDAGVRFSVTCPSDGTDLTEVPFEHLPACRQTFDEFGTRRIDWAPAAECSVALHASDLSIDELFDEVPEFEISSPVRVEYRWSGYDADALHLRPTSGTDTPTGLRIAGDLTPDLLDTIRRGLSEPGEWDATVVAALVGEIDRQIDARRSLADSYLAVCSELNQASRDERDARVLLAHFVDDEPCQFDHHGACQAHGVSGPPCRNAEARRLLGMDTAAEAGVR